MKEERRIATARAFFDGWKKGDFSVGSDLLAPDVVIGWSEPPVDVVSRGRAQIGERLQKLLRQWDGFRAEAEELIPVGDESVLAVARQRAAGKGSGVDVDARVYIVMVFRGDRVAEIHWYFDRAKALAAAGLPEDAA